MSTNLEIEFKNLLTKAEYEQLLNFFSLDEQAAVLQKNIYFDTAKKQLKAQRAALRIRIKANTYELTLKTKVPEGALEINQKITERDYLCMISEGFLIKGGVYDGLVKLGVNPVELQEIAKLTTKRIEFPYESGTLFLDESRYGSEVDYEVEYEALDYNRGGKTFRNFLSIHHIPIRPAEPKIRRAEKSK